VDAFIQFLSSGLTEGARYALVALGFTLIYNASGALNFAQGESVMIGGMVTAVLLQTQMPFWLAMLLAVLAGLAVSLLLQRVFTYTLQRSGVLQVIILTVAFGIMLRGLAHVLWGTQTRSIPPFSGSEPLRIGGATILPQALWVMGITAVVLAGLAWFSATAAPGVALSPPRWTRPLRSSWA